MACYISSNDNRFYAALESSYGAVPAISAAHMFPGVRLSAQQRVEAVERRDKTGTRSFVGLPSRLRRGTSFQLDTYLTSWNDPVFPPPLDPLFQGALGSALRFNGGTVAQSPDGRTLQFANPHGLVVGQAVVFGGEIRFVATQLDASTVQVNAPFTIAPTPGSIVGATVSYLPATRLPGVTIFDYWSVGDTVHRIMSGAGVNEMSIKVNGDFHELRFSGPARDVIDSASFQDGQGALSAFPSEPPITRADYSVVPGNLGQVWLGNNGTQFFTLTSGEVVVNNDIETRNREFGFDLPQCIVPGARTVSVKFSLYEQGNDATKELYQAARQRSPISVMLQLGEQPGQVLGIYLKSVVPEVPEFDDSERRLQWAFRESRAQGSMDDEISIAIG